LPLTFRVYSAIFLPTTAEQDGAKASFDLIYGGGALCPTLRRPSVWLMGCVGGQLGFLRSHPETMNRGIDEKTALIWNGVSEVRVTIPVIAPVALTAGASAVLPLLRPTFGYTHANPAAGNDTIHRVSIFAVTADAGLGFFFP
jgi:hypothetical protein